MWTGWFPRLGPELYRKGESWIIVSKEVYSLLTLDCGWDVTSCLSSCCDRSEMRGHDPEREA